VQDYQPPLRIGIFPLVQQKLLRTIAEFTARHPQVTFSITEGHSGTDLCHSLLMEELDCVIVFRKHVPQLLKKTLLFDSPLVLAVHRSLVEIYGDHPSWAQLAALPLINISANDKAFESNPLTELRLTGAARLQVDSPVTAMDAIRNRLGAAVICEHAVTECADDDVVTFPLPKTYLRHITLARHPETRLAPAHETFLRFLEASWHAS
ncbi:MAG: LysR family transcriptional regulator substrate-binding protein, partial [Mailhella sp.]|nr:LysR family transcriptional regulator substrate-binding protein [Mailhella sp.]